MPAALPQNVIQASKSFEAGVFWYWFAIVTAGALLLSLIYMVAMVWRIPRVLAARSESGRISKLGAFITRSVLVLFIFPPVNFALFIFGSAIISGTADPGESSPKKVAGVGLYS